MEKRQTMKGRTRNQKEKGNIVMIVNKTKNKYSQVKSSLESKNFKKTSLEVFSVEFLWVFTKF